MNGAPSQRVGSLAATVTGSGEPVLVIHGLTGCAQAMAPLVDRLGGYRRIAVDLPGHGNSESPADLDRYSVDATVDALAELLVKLNATPCAAVGYSMGGRVALSLAAARPELCRSLVLVSATAGIADPPERARRRRADAALADLIAQRGLRHFVDRWTALPMWDTLRGRLGPAAWQASIRQRLACHPLGLAHSLRAAGTGSMRSLWQELDSVEAPTLLLCGELDTKFVDLAGQMARRLPNSQLIVLPDTGHAAHLEQPDACAVAIREHLAAL